MQALHGLSDKTESFIQFSHQDGALQDSCTQGFRDYKQKYKSQHKADNHESHPKYQAAKEKIRAERKLHSKKDATKERMEEKKRRWSDELEKK